MNASIHSCLFRRADGSLREFCYDGTGAMAIYNNVPPEREVPRPRNIDRPYRNLLDQPSEYTHLLRRLRQSVYCGREDITCCSRCSHPVTSRTTDNTATKDKPTHHAFMMSPRQVFRDLVMTDPVSPIRPPLRDALVAAIDASQQARARRPSSRPTSYTTPATTFPRFMELPYEIRHMIWVLVLPARLLLWEDLFRDWRYGWAKDVPPEIMPHTINQLWRSDLFYTCVESRRLVEAYEGRREACPIIGISSMHKLERGFDELYYPWLGNQSTLAAAAVPRSSHHTAPGGSTAAEDILEPVLTAKLPDCRWPARLQDKDLHMPAVALDAGWIDSCNRHALAWIGGCYDQRSAAAHEHLPDFLAANRSFAVSPSAAALRRVDVVVADILVPVALRLDQCTPAQRMLLLQDAAGRYTTGDSDTIPALAGRDFTVLVDLYDDWRIDEILSLQAPPPAHPARPRYGNHTSGWRTGLAGRIVNKAASHPCIRCTRAEWEARSWRPFGERLGGRLKRLCRPMVVFSVIVEFVNGGDLWEEYQGAQKAYELMRADGQPTR